MTILKLYWAFKSLVKIICFKILFGKRFSIGKGSWFRTNFGIYLDKNAKIKIGNRCFFNRNCSVNCLESIEIGDNTIFGEGVKIYDHNHRFSDKAIPIRQQGFTTDKVVIGNNCWICSNVTILKGTVIGDNCVIGTGCIISGNIPANSIVKNSSENSVTPIN